MKTIVTHTSPDVDALSSVWLIHKFLPGWEEAEVAFISQGTTYNNKPVDSNSDVIHVDLGLGKFDHHQLSGDTCAAKLVFEYVRDKGYVKEKHVEPLERMVIIINNIDHFRDVYLPDANSDVYDFGINSIIEGMKVRLQDDHYLAILADTIFDGILQTFFNKVQAEKEMNQGLIFQSHWGKTLAIHSENEEVSNVAQKHGYDMVIRKSIKKGHLKVKLNPKCEAHLEVLLPLLKKADPKANWFYHASGHMIISGSSKSPNSIPSTLTLEKVVEIIKSVK